MIFCALSCQFLEPISLFRYGEVKGAHSTSDLRRSWTCIHSPHSSIYVSTWPSVWQHIHKAIPKVSTCSPPVRMLLCRVVKAGATPSVGPVFIVSLCRGINIHYLFFCLDIYTLRKVGLDLLRRLCLKHTASWFSFLERVL